MQAVDLFLWLCALGMALVIPLTVAKKRAVLLSWLVAYTLIYSYLSLQGQYVAKSATSPRKHWAALYCQSSQTGKFPGTLTPVGAFFLPLVWGDRLIIHRTQKPPVPGRIPGIS